MSNHRVVYNEDGEKMKPQCYMCPGHDAQAPQQAASIASVPKSDDQ